MAVLSSRSQCGVFSLAVVLAMGSTGLPAQDGVAFDLQPGDTSATADYQEQHGDLKFLKGRVEIATDQFVVTGDEARHNEATGQIEAKGNVRYRHLIRREDIYADKLSYNARSEGGTFYKVHGIVESASQGGPRLLSTDNPFYIQGEIVYKAGSHYTVHKGYVTNCEVDDPWWTLRTPKTKIVPGGHATIHRGIFRLKGIPIFYFPYFRKSLKRLPRQSGFLTPNIGNSSRFGFVLGQSYYWAINRSYDATFGGTWFSDRGIATRLGFRGRPTRGSYFGASFYGVLDRGFKTSDGRRIKQGGRTFEMEGAATMPGGFRGVMQLNYLSSLEFRQAFTQSFAEAVQSQMRSIGFMSKDLSTFSMNVSLLRGENFQSVRPDDKVILRQLPSLEFNSRDRQLFDGPVPLWFSLDSSFGLVSRTQETFQTRRFVQRGDVFPRLTSSFRLAEFRFTPSFGVRHTAYGQRREQGSLQGMNFYRNSREFSLDIAAPSFQRIFEGPKWLGDRVKHVIEPRIRYRFVDGIDNFDKVIRFDGRDLLTNTNEADISIMNRLYAKDAATGGVREVASLEIWQRRYFDPEFGGALVPGRRNVFSSTVDVTPFAFLDQARNYSPIVSSFRIRPNWRTFLGWRTDYDPLRRRIVNSSVDSGWRINALWNVEVGHHAVRTPVELSPPSNQLSTLVRLGDFNRRGWNVAVRTNYDYGQHIFIYNATQATYNTDCCGFSFEWRRFAIGHTRNENQFRVALSIANVGSFGTLSPRERMF